MFTHFRISLGLKHKSCLFHHHIVWVWADQSVLCPKSAGNELLIGWTICRWAYQWICQTGLNMALTFFFHVFFNSNLEMKWSCSTEKGYFQQTNLGDFSDCSNKKWHKQWQHMEVSWNRGTPKSGILIGFSIKHHPFWGTIILANHHMFFFPVWDFPSYGTVADSWPNMTCFLCGITGEHQICYMLTHCENFGDLWCHQGHLKDVGM